MTKYGSPRKQRKALPRFASSDNPTDRKAHMIGLIKREFPKEAQERYLKALDEVWKVGMSFDNLCTAVGARQREILGR